METPYTEKRLITSPLITLSAEVMAKPLAPPALVPSTSIKSVAGVPFVASAAPGWL